MFDGSKKLDGERNVDQSVGLVSQETRTVLTTNFLRTPKLWKWSTDAEKSEEQNCSCTDDNRRYCEKIGHHELQATYAEEECYIPREELINKILQRWRNHITFQSSTFDTIARRKLIEDQNTILELSGRVQELQNKTIV